MIKESNGGLKVSYCSIVGKIDATDTNANLTLEEIYGADARACANYLINRTDIAAPFIYESDSAKVEGQMLSLEPV